MTDSQKTWHGHYGVWIGNPYGKTPTMHLFGRYKDGREVSACGRVQGSTYLLLAHAEKFAKRCTVCDHARRFRTP